uniref:Cytochrome c oxidase subunit 2 n=1 Tax=Argulus americanus TaxID=260819 RepID=Q6SL23_9CRUS|nr:cytochrome c oxidase subunit II [Argulus americanus]AAS00850.1 cytochrome c oxidase subunit 2 [Argulus americanus]
MATWMDLTFQDSVSPLMEFMMFFHDHVIVILSLICFISGYLLYMSLSNRFLFKTSINSHLTELIWLFMPALILIFVSLPSIKILYLLENSKSPAVTIKTSGHQWYWSYEYSDFWNIEFDSYMLPYENLEQFRLLDVDNRTVIPMLTRIRFLITASDVLHAWALPALSIKMDAVPGRLNQIMTYLYRPGLYYGQCSEICGVNHSFMPIVLEVVSNEEFKKWVSTY